MLSADSLYLQGSSHTVCQDYARSGVITSYADAFAYGIVSDGCSSSPDTDIGARLTVLETEHVLLTCPNPNEPLTRWLPKIAYGVRDRADMLHVSPQCSDATLLEMHFCPQKKEVGFSMIGDGYLIARHKNTSQYRILQRTFTNNTPWYLSYTTFPERFRQLVEQEIRIEYLSHHLDVDKGIVTTTPLYTTTITKENCSLHSPEHRDTFTTYYYDLFLVLSDGVDSFVETNQETREKRAIPATEVLLDLLDFKNFTGEFVTRRLRKAVKEFQKKHWIHEDDLAIAAIYVGD